MRRKTLPVTLPRVSHDLVDIPPHRTPPNQSTTLPPSVRNLMDESFADIDVVADIFGNGPAETPEKSTPSRSVGSGNSWCSAIDLDSLFPGKSSSLKKSSPLN